MNKEKQARLEKAGWKIGNIQELLDLTDAETKKAGIMSNKSAQNKSSQNKSYELFLPYYKKGDDLQQCRNQTKSDAEALKAHADAMDYSAKALRQMASLAADGLATIEVSDCHAIYFSVDETLGAQLQSEGLLYEDTFDDDDSDDLDDSDTDPNDTDTDLNSPDISVGKQSAIDMDEMLFED